MNILQMYIVCGLHEVSPCPVFDVYTCINMCRSVSILDGNDAWYGTAMRKMHPSPVCEQRKGCNSGHYIWQCYAYVYTCTRQA